MVWLDRRCTWWGGIMGKTFSFLPPESANAETASTTPSAMHLLDAAKGLNSKALSLAAAIEPGVLPDALVELFIYLVCTRLTRKLMGWWEHYGGPLSHGYWLDGAGGIHADVPCAYDAGYRREWMCRRVFFWAPRGTEVAFCWRVADKGKGRLSLSIGYSTPKHMRDNSTKFLHISNTTSLPQTSNKGRDLPGSLAVLCEAWEICGDRTPYLVLDGKLPFEDPQGLF